MTVVELAMIKDEVSLHPAEGLQSRMRGGELCTRWKNGQLKGSPRVSEVAVSEEEVWPGWSRGNLKVERCNGV